MEGHETPNAEVETWNFLVDISNNKIDITKKQYIEETQKVLFSVESKYFIYNETNYLSHTFTVDWDINRKIMI